MPSRGEIISAKAWDVDKFRAKLNRIVGPQAEAIIAKASAANAADLANTVRRIVPRGENDDDGALADTITVSPAGRTGAQVSIGSASQPYPLHLEVGHKARDGSHVPGKAYWFPSKRVTKKRAHGRMIRAERAVIKMAAGSSSGGAT